MTEEFNLSAKVRETVVGDRYPDYDVKEFIRRLKEEIGTDYRMLEVSEKEIFKFINKLAGPKLIESALSPFTVGGICIKHKINLLVDDDGEFYCEMCKK